MFGFNKKPNGYKVYTVRELIVALRELAENSQNIDLDSEVVISDYNMSGFKEKFKLHPVRLYGRTCVGLFHSLEEDEESELKSKPLREEPNRSVKFVKKK